MKASELIKELQDAISLVGDKDVYVCDNFGEYEMATEVIQSEFDQEETTIRIIP